MIKCKSDFDTFTRNEKVGGSLLIINSKTKSRKNSNLHKVLLRELPTRFLLLRIIQSFTV